MICPTYSSPQYFIFSDQVPQLLYYSHLPAIILSLVVGILVLLKGKSLVSKILFLISLSFSFWCIVNLITWTNNDSDVIFFVWSFFNLLDVFIYIFSFYFFYVYVRGKDLSLIWRLALFIITLPVIFLTPTRYNLKGFDLTVCGVNNLENQYFVNYGYILGILCLLFLTFFTIYEFKKEKNSERKKQVLLLGVGITLFLVFFVAIGFVISLLVSKGIMQDYGLEQYGLFGVIFFLGFLAYLIVKYKAFNIKLLGTQALVIALVVATASQFFVTDLANVTKVVIICVTVLINTIFGIVLINSVRNEVKRKEELQNMSDQLSTANDELRKLDNAKSEFISIASHQLRTPLTAIKGFISMIIEGTYGQVSDTVRDALNKVYLSNERIISLVENLLTVSRIESGRIEYKFELARMEDIIKELNDIFVLIAKQKGINLKILLPKDPLPAIEMDGQKIRELVSNLVDNALKYSSEGEVSVKAEMATSEYVRVTVSDNGIGIPKEELPYLFAKFSRGKDINRLHAGGTGLGLFVCKNIVEAHKGKIWVESDGAGKGSRFIMELPVKHEA